VGVTVLAAAALLAGGMPLFDSLCHAFGTVATGGFSVRNTSYAWYDSAYLDAVTTVFMLAAGTNFGLHYAAIHRGARSYWRNEEFRFFIVSYVIATIAVAATLALRSEGIPVASAVRLSSFNVASIMSCTGFASGDFALWPPFAQAALFYLLFPGGCAGSTAGAIKNVRVLLMMKSIWSALQRALHPQAVVQPYYNKAAVRRETMASVAASVTLYLASFSLASLGLTLTGMDMLSAISATAACLANCGPGLGSVGPMSNYADLTAAAKWVLDACMLLGRLELFTVMILFTRSYWRG
jgi:trk system potassium uptake protein TrkH